MTREGGVGAAMPHPARPAAPERRPRNFSWPLFRLGAKARHLLLHPPDPWPGDAARGRRLLDFDAGEFWRRDGSAEEFDPHRFAWLRDLRAAGGDAARTQAQTLVKAWLARSFMRQRGVRAPAVIADRLVHWVGQFDFYAKTAPQSLKAPLFRSMAHQARALARVAPRIAATAERVRALRALIAFGAAVPGAQARLEQAMRLLVPLLEDWPRHGLIAARNPSDQLAALRDLFDIRAFLAAAQHELPPTLDPAIAAIGRALSALRHGDGALALFHGGMEEGSSAIDAALALAGIQAAAPSRFSAGFERATSGDSLLILDAAAPDAQFRAAHASTLGFEFSAGAARLIVNCGAARRGDPAWRNAGRVTAAHSTLVVGDRNSSGIRAAGGLRNVARVLAVERQDEAGATWISASHDGYLARFGLIHSRRLFLAADGADLRGEDRLAPPPGQILARKVLGTSYCIRFHLHPDVVVGTPETDSAGASAVPLANGVSGPWQLVSEGGLAVIVEESFYLGRGAPRKSRQIVLTGRIANAEGAEARWAIRRMR